MRTWACLPLASLSPERPEWGPQTLCTPRQGLFVRILETLWAHAGSGAAILAGRQDL